MKFLNKKATIIILSFCMVLSFTKTYSISFFSSKKSTPAKHTPKKVFTLRRALVGGTIVSIIVILAYLGYLVKKLKRDFGPGTLPNAMARNDLQEVQRLIDEGADVDKVYSFGLTPLFFALIQNKPEMVQILLDNNANPNLKNLFGLSLLHFAIAKPQINLETIALLVEGGVDVNIQCYGIPPLTLAASCQRLDVVGLLIAHGANLPAGFENTNVNLSTQKKKPNYYNILGLKQDATKKSIAKKYRKLVFETHPDRNRDKDTDEKRALEEQTKQLNEAYACLTNLEMRKKHDAEIQQGLWA